MSAASVECNLINIKKAHKFFLGGGGLFAPAPRFANTSPPLQPRVQALGTKLVPYCKKHFPTPLINLGDNEYNCREYQDHSTLNMRILYAVGK